MLFKIKKEVYIFLIVFIIALCMCIAFLQPHYTHDTYFIGTTGYITYSLEHFLPEGRPITALLTMFAGLINLDIEIYGIISFILSIAFLSLSVVILYQIINSNQKDFINKIITLMISYLIIFNYLMIEHIYFMESCIMSLGVLLSIYACKIMIKNEKHKYIKTYLLLMIAVFCYQGSIAIFPIILLAYYAIVEKYDLKTYIKFLIKIMLVYVSLMLLNILFIKIFFGTSRIQMHGINFNIMEIGLAIKNLTIDSLHVIMPYIHMGIIAVTIIALAVIKNTSQNKLLILSKYLITILTAIGICLMPIVTGSGLELQPHTCIAFGATIGISLLFIFEALKGTSHKKLFQWIIFSIIAILCILNATLYFILTHQHLQVNKLDRDILEKVSEKIVEYETQNHTKVTKIAILYDKNQKEYEEGIIQTPAYNLRATASWASPYVIQFYTKRDLQTVLPDKETYFRFKAEDWNEFSEEQIYILNDTLYFCIY